MADIKEAQHRCFLALPLADPSLRDIKQLRYQLAAHVNKKTWRQLHWIKDQNLHTTLYFLGNQTSANIKKLIESLSKINNLIKRFSLNFNLLTFFPPAHPHIIALIGELNPELVNLLAQLKHILIELNISFDDKPFIPHVSLARFKQAIEFNPLKFNMQLPVTEFVLFKSVTASEGVEYSCLARIELL